MTGSHYRCPECREVDVSYEIDKCPCGHGTQMEYVERLDQKMVESEAKWIRSVMDRGIDPDDIECQVKVPTSVTYFVDFVFYGDLAVEHKRDDHGELAHKKGWQMDVSTDMEYHVVTGHGEVSIPCDKVWWDWEKHEFVSWLKENYESMETESESRVKA